MLKDIGLTTLRWLLGMMLGTAMAVVCYFAGLPGAAPRRALTTVIDFLRAIPVIALVPLFFYFFSVQERGKILMIAVATALPIYIHIVNAARASDKQKLVFTAARMSPWELVRWIHAPLLARALANGIQIAIGIGWISVVAAESLGTPDRSFWDGGLGHQIIKFASVGQYGGIYLYLILFGLLGTASALAFRGLVSVMRRVTGLELQ